MMIFFGGGVIDGGGLGNDVINIFCTSLPDLGCVGNELRILDI